MRRFVVSSSILIAASAGAQQQPPIRQLPPVAAKSAVPWNNIIGVRALPGGRVLVNDVFGRKVVLLDSTLAPITVVADTTPATSTAYSGRIASLIPFRGDSTLFVDPQSMSMMVVDPNGKMTRVMALPRTEDAAALGGLFGANAGLDAKGRLIYRAPFRFIRNGPPQTSANGLPMMPAPPESAMIVRVDLATRQVDTVGVIRIPKVTMQVSQDEKGNMRINTEVNPLPVVDEWAVLSDGGIAFIRGQDYHVDFVNPDGTKRTAPKIPFDWQRLTDEDKIAFIDSVKAARERLAAAQQAQQGTSAQGASGRGPAGAPDGAGGQRIVIQMGPGGGGAAGGSVTGGQPQVNLIAPSELPDYKPPFFSNSVRADAEGNVWVRTIPTKQIPGGPVYDVINSDGKLVDRVQIPVGRTIAGFGADGAVYLVSRDGTTMTFERAHVR